jgi:hypothetical protein
MTAPPGCPPGAIVFVPSPAPETIYLTTTLEETTLLTPTPEPTSADAYAVAADTPRVSGGRPAVALAPAGL